LPPPLGKGETMYKILKKSKGKTIRLYTISGVESYLGTLQDVNEDYVTLKDAMHGEVTYIAIQHIESFHEARLGKR
jgi:ferredoxin-fold anticodon binding domain-containing protein